MKPSSSSSSSATPTQDLVSQMTTEYCLEFARELARKAVSATATSISTTIPQQNMQSSIIQGGLANNLILGVQHKQEEDVFGYRFKICKDCLSTEALQVRFGKEGTKDNNKNSNSNNNNNNNNDSVEVVSRIEQKHVCDPKVVASNRKEVLDKEGSVKAMVDKLPANSINVTKWWIENQKNSCCSLIAIKIPHKKKNNDNDNEDNIADNGGDNIQPEQEHIKIPNPKNPKQQITFRYSKEKHINLSLISNESSKNHYAARAITYGYTILTNEEMEDFLKMVQTSTFAISKIHMPSSIASSSLPLQHQHHYHHQQQDESIGLYFLAILPYDNTLYSQSYLPNKSNNNNNKSVQSNSTDETFSSLYDHLVNISNLTL